MATTKTTSTKSRTASKSPAKSLKPTTVKKSVVKKTSEVKVSASAVSPSLSKASAATLFRVRKTPIIIGVVIILLIGLAVYYRSLFVVAMVNGQPISRLAYINETESVYIPDARVTAGKQALNQLVTKTLLFQEAKKRNIVITQKEVDAEVATTRKSLEKSNQKLEEALSAQGDTLVAYKERIKIQKLIEKLVGNVTVSDKDIADYMEKNKDSIPQTADVESIKNQVKETIKQQKYNEKLQALIQGLQQKAKVSYL